MERLVILGGGESGVGTAILGKKEGFEIFLSDAGKIKEEYKNVLVHLGIDWEEGRHSEEKILTADLVMKSPGIPDAVPLVQQLVQQGIPVISEIEFASRYTDAFIIGITGSNGKTTTTMLTHHILKNGGLHVGMAGCGTGLPILCAGNQQFSIRWYPGIQTGYCDYHEYYSRPPGPLRLPV